MMPRGATMTRGVASLAVAAWAGSARRYPWAPSSELPGARIAPPMTQRAASGSARPGPTPARSPEDDRALIPRAERIRLHLADAWGEMGAAWGIAPAIARV